MTEQMRMMSEMERNFQKQFEAPFEAMKSRQIGPQPKIEKNSPTIQTNQADQPQVVKEFASEEFSNKETITDCDNKTKKCTT